MTIGIVPCAGTATRIHGLPKYLLPLPDGYLLSILIERINVVSTQVVIAVSHENYSLVNQYKKTAFVYIAAHHATMTETVLSCKFDDDVVIFGMPDTYIEDEQCYPKLIAALDDGADVAVALFLPRPNQHLKSGMCTVLGNQVQEVVDKPVNKLYFTHLWGAMAWKPVFWGLLQPEYPHVGYALPHAIRRGLDVRAVKCEGQYFDCGDYAGYEELVLHLHGRKEASEMKQIYG